MTGPLLTPGDNEMVEAGMANYSNYGAPARSDDKVPMVTWAIGVATIAVVAAAAYLLVTDKPKAEPGNAVQIAQELEATSAQEPPVAPENPLDLSAKMVDAQERALIWKEKAQLASVEVSIKDGAELGALVVEFGESLSNPRVGATLGSKRLRLEYEGREVKSATLSDTKLRTALPVPNCPFEAAFGALRRLENPDGTSLIRYVSSPKHGRPVWLMTTESGKVASVDADNCAILTR